MATPDPDHGSALDSSMMSLVDDLLASLGATIHDGPVQQLIAAKLLTESVLPSDGRSELADRAIKSMISASDQARTIMWALTTPMVREGMAHVDVPQILDRLDGAAVDVAVTDDCEHQHLTTVARAIHDTVAGALLAGEDVVSVRLQGDSDGLNGEIAITGRQTTEPSPWDVCAAARLRQDGGTHHISPSAGGVQIDLLLSRR